MNSRRLTLIEVLQPQCFSATPERSRVTRTILQPEIDAFEQREAQAGAADKSVLATGRRGVAPSTRVASQRVGA
jgi:hypothetical protein